MCKARLARAVSETGCREQRTFVNQLPTDCDRNSASVACAQPGLKCVGMLRVVESQLVEQQRGPQQCRQ